MRQFPLSVRFFLSAVAGLLLCGSAASVQAATPAKDAGGQSSMARRADRCIDIPARAAARLAYLQTRLELNASQTPLFTRWKDVKLSAAKQMQTRCDARFKSGTAQQAMNSSPVDRLARTQERLQQRLSDIRAERPALDALYASLSDTQKAKFGQGNMSMHGMDMRNMRRGGMMRQMHGSMRSMPDHPAPAPAP